MDNTGAYIPFRTGGKGDDIKPKEIADRIEKSLAVNLTEKHHRYPYYVITSVRIWNIAGCIVDDFLYPERIYGAVAHLKRRGVLLDLPHQPGYQWPRGWWEICEKYREEQPDE